MPRIDPIQLLNCISVLLSSNGGIKSRDEVQRLASLMTKFSKKLVSKCIYIQILKCTESELLGLFMGSGGWSLVHTWLTESVVAKNSPLIKELLELLLLCPVGIERLKTNNCPKLVKELSRDGNNLAIRALASKLVEQWLKTVKSEQVVPVSLFDISQIVSGAQLEINSTSILKSECNVEQKHFEGKLSDSEKDKGVGGIEKRENVDGCNSDGENKDQPNKEKSIHESETLPVLKISLKDGKQTVSHVVDNDTKILDRSSDSDNYREKHKSKSKEKSSEKHSSDSKSRSSKHSSKSDPSSDKHKSSSSSHRRSKDKSRDRDKHYKSKRESSKKSSDKSSSSSSRSKDERGSKSINKDRIDKDEKAKVKSDDSKTQVPSIQKLGKIPKLSDVKKDKPSLSIEIRKPDEPKPKTVKTFHSKFRKHGLEEEIKPPPSRAALLTKKPLAVLPSTVAIPKRPSPVHSEPPPEKKPKVTDTIEKPGAIKLIPPKPKRSRSSLPFPVSSSSVFYNSLGLFVFCAMMLLESDMFMDALNASTNKKDPKKRKRRTSGSKDGNAPNDGSPPNTPTIVNSPNGENKSVPPRFYQDTLESDTTKDKVEEKNTNNEENTETDIEKAIEEKMDTSEPHTLTINGIKGVLCYHKKKGPKKSIKWKTELEEIQYFELDETERVNVTKTFTDMKYLERINEREAFQKARNLSTDDIMEEKTNWKPLIPIDVCGQTYVDYGKNSKEKDIQAIRQKGTLQPLYFHKSMIPDSALEPDAEAHPYSEPTIIPLDDVTGNQDNVSDFRTMPWPEPKGNAPPSNANSNLNIPAIFPPVIPQFPTTFPNAQFPVVPNFQPPNMVPGDWPNGIPAQILPNGLPVPLGPTAMNPVTMAPGNIPPGMMLPPDNMMMGPEMFNGPNPMYPPDGFNMQQNMFPMDFNMPGPQGQIGPGDGFPGPGNFRGAMRGRSSAGHWRGKGPGNWDVHQRGGRGGSRGSRKAVCIYFQRKGSCRQGDNCTFLHPGVNCSY